ncbi:MAG: hypothetical protein MJE68_25135 [Proteobacteria bacterium]|nr:hypothetical protein [Pseudomonadota bacterium]
MSQTRIETVLNDLPQSEEVKDRVIEWLNDTKQSMNPEKGVETKARKTANPIIPQTPRRG